MPASPPGEALGGCAAVRPTGAVALEGDMYLLDKLQFELQSWSRGPEDVEIHIRVRDAFAVGASPTNYNLLTCSGRGARRMEYNSRSR